MIFLVLIGAASLGFSLFPAHQILSNVREKGVRNYWYILIALTVFFIIIYITYYVLDTLGMNSFNASIVPVTLFSGALFVLIVSLFSARTITALKRIETLERENITDPLMGIYNRRYYDQRIVEEFNRSRRYELPLSITIFDLDCFKELNDSYGHNFGDHVLKSVGEIIKENIREIDVPARFGGDEIILIHPNTDLAGARMLSQRLKLSIGKTNFAETFPQIPGKQIYCSVSLGIAELKVSMKNPQALLNAADLDLYTAKSSGGSNELATTD